jgi:hypothetical protein
MHTRGIIWKRLTARKKRDAPGARSLPKNERHTHSNRTIWPEPQCVKKISPFVLSMCAGGDRCTIHKSNQRISASMWETWARCSFGEQFPQTGTAWRDMRVWNFWDKNPGCLPRVCLHIIDQDPDRMHKWDTHLDPSPEPVPPATELKTQLPPNRHSCSINLRNSSLILSRPSVSINPCAQLLPRPFDDSCTTDAGNSEFCVSFSRFDQVFFSVSTRSCFQRLRGYWMWDGCPLALYQNCETFHGLVSNAISQRTLAIFGIEIVQLVSRTVQLANKRWTCCCPLFCK